MCVHEHVCMSVCAHERVCVCVHEHVCMHERVCVCTSMCVYMSVCVCSCIYHKVSMWRSEDNLQEELVLSFHSVDPENLTRVVWLGILAPLLSEVSCRPVVNLSGISESVGSSNATFVY